MMRSLLTATVLAYYFLGMLLLPMGDFSVLPDLPAMYRQCKATEDKDMGPVDFLTDHLINFDGVFDKHNNGDEQKPHQPFHFQHNPTLITAISIFQPQVFQTPAAPEKSFFLPEDQIYTSDFSAKIFHPPSYALFIA